MAAELAPRPEHGPGRAQRGLGLRGPHERGEVRVEGRVLQPVPGGRTGEAPTRGEAHLVPPGAQAGAERQEGLHVAAGAERQDQHAHGGQPRRRFEASVARPSRQPKEESGDTLASLLALAERGIPRGFRAGIFFPP